MHDYLGSTPTRPVRAGLLGVRGPLDRGCSEFPFESWAEVYVPSSAASAYAEVCPRSSVVTSAPGFRRAVYRSPPDRPTARPPDSRPPAYPNLAATTVTLSLPPPSSAAPTRAEAASLAEVLVVNN